jgi:hypothetical protein
MSKRDRRILAKLSRVKAMKAGRFNQKLIDDLESFIARDIDRLFRHYRDYGSAIDDMWELKDVQVSNRRQFENEVDGMLAKMDLIAKGLKLEHVSTRQAIQNFQSIAREYGKYSPDMNWVAGITIHLNQHRESIEDAMDSLQRVRKSLQQALGASTFNRKPFGGNTMFRDLHMIHRVVISQENLERMREQWLGEMRDLQRTVRQRNKRLPQ